MVEAFSFICVPGFFLARIPGPLDQTFRHCCATCFFFGGWGGGGGVHVRGFVWLLPSQTIDQIGPKILGLLCGCRRWFNFEWEVTGVVFPSMNQIIPNFQGSLDLCRRFFFRPLHGHLSTKRPKSFPMIGRKQTKVLAQKIHRASSGVPDKIHGLNYTKHSRVDVYL